MVFFIVLLLILMGVATALGREARRTAQTLRWINLGRVLTWGLMVLVVVLMFQSRSGGPAVLDDFRYGFQEFWYNLTNNTPDPYDPYYQDPPDPNGPYDPIGG